MSGEFRSPCLNRSSSQVAVASSWELPKIRVSSPRQLSRTSCGQPGRGMVRSTIERERERKQRPVSTPDKNATPRKKNAQTSNPNTPSHGRVIGYDGTGRGTCSSRARGIVELGENLKVGEKVCITGHGRDEMVVVSSWGCRVLIRVRRVGSRSQSRMYRSAETPSADTCSGPVTTPTRPTPTST